MPYSANTDSVIHHHHHHQSLNRGDRWSTKDDFSTSFLHFPLFSTILWDLPNSRPVHSPVLSPHLFLCPPCLFPPFTVPCKMVLARPDERETWPYHCSLHLFKIVRRSSCGPIACWILARTFSLVTWLSAITRTQITNTVFLDLKKAFDLFDHSILNAK